MRNEALTVGRILPFFRVNENYTGPLNERKENPASFSAARVLLAGN
jgi:hypothetical protein